MTVSRISVALCTHNGAAFIAEQLASILAQTRLPDQLVISDDASTDDTVALIHRIIAGAAASIRIDVTRNTEALGVTANFQQALEACSGDLIALCDQDDTWMPDRLAVLGERFDADPELLVLGSDATIIDADGASRGFGLFEALDISAREFGEVHRGDSFAALLRRNLFTGATMMVRADLVSVASPFPGEWVHDEWLAIVGAATGKVDLLEVPLIGYRQHGANQIGARRLSLRGKVGRLFEERAQSNTELADRADALLAGLRRLGSRVPADRLAAAEGKVRHQRLRAGLPDSRIIRVVPVMTELLRGGYSRFARGAADAFRDITQRRLG